jgi:uncharacterized membrane protein
MPTRTTAKLQSDHTTTKHRANTVEALTVIAATALAAFYFASSIYISSHRLLWFDEIFTVYMARLPHWVAIWKAVADAADTMSPVYDMVVRVFDKVLGHSEVVARLPSALAMAAGLLITFDCARRLTDGLHGLIALSVLTCSFLPYYGYEARSYAIYFMFAAIGLWVWTCTKNTDRLGALAFGAIVFVGVTIHYFFVLCMVPYALWELSRWMPWRPPSPKLISGSLGVGLAVALLAPVMFSFSRQFSVGFWAHPTLHDLIEIYSDLFPSGLFMLAIIAIWIALASPKDGSVTLLPMNPAESVGWLFLCIPLAGFLLAELKTNAFYNRYFIGTLPGVALAFACWVWRHFRSSRRVSFGILLFLAMWGAVMQIAVARNPRLIKTYGQQLLVRRYLDIEGSLGGDGKRFVLFSNPVLFMEAQYYASGSQECVLLLLPNGTQEDNWARQELFLSRYHPLQFWKIEDLSKHAQETALIQPTPAVLDAIEQAGLKAEVRFRTPLEVVYFK